MKEEEDDDGNEETINVRFANKELCIAARAILFRYPPLLLLLLLLLLLPLLLPLLPLKLSSMLLLF